MATDSAKSGEVVPTPTTNEVLKLDDVLSGIPLDRADTAGAYIIFQTIGGSTVISVDAGGPGPAQPVAVITLANVTGMTLQDLLNDSPLQC